MPVLFARIPEERLGVLIGPGGETKRELEAATRAQVEIDPEDGQVRIATSDDDPDGAMKARDIVVAIGRGFSPVRAFRLLKDDTYLAVIDIKSISGKKAKAAVWRIRSRLIGEGGRARERIEELSGCFESVFGNSVALIGNEHQLERATRAVELLLRGSEHSTVFHMLARQRSEDARDAAMAPETDDAVL